MKRYIRIQYHEFLFPYMDMMRDDLNKQFIIEEICNHFGIGKTQASVRYNEFLMRWRRYIYKSEIVIQPMRMEGDNIILPSKV